MTHVPVALGGICQQAVKVLRQLLGDGNAA
jgi:hypothetical protein